MIESIAVIFSLISVWLTTKKNTLCWPIGIVGVIAYSILFYQNRDWSNFSLQFVFIIQSIFGWINWKDAKTEQITGLKNYERFIVGIATISLSLFLFFINSIFSGNSAELDALTTSLSIFGMFLLSNSKVEAWIFWILADLIYIYLFFSQQLYLSSIIYFIFLILATYGFFNWNKIKRKAYD